MSQMKPRAFMVAVQYSDLLAVTLPHNAHHFSESVIITDSKCFEEVREIAVRSTVAGHSVSVLMTDIFYRNARFNKWAALEWGFDQKGRHGLICNMDADVLWPKDAVIPTIQKGELWGPLRRMAPWPCVPVDRPLVAHQYVHGEYVPTEGEWTKYPHHRNVNEWAGYSQVFWGDDPHLNECANCGHWHGEDHTFCNCTQKAWHQTDWVHAGGADSFFQAKWPTSQKHRFSWDVLHLGEAGENWAGRATPLADGSELPGSAERREYAGREIWANRRKNRMEGRDQFEGERIGN